MIFFSGGQFAVLGAPLEAWFGVEAPGPGAPEAAVASTAEVLLAAGGQLAGTLAFFLKCRLRFAAFVLG
jgi:hypothetical protein